MIAGRRTMALGAALALALGACTSGKTFIATAADYHDYRATRVSPTFEGRVGAAARYLERHPGGAYAEEVHAYFARAEMLYFERSEKTIEGLEGYLDLLPKGPHAGEARDGLAYLRERSNRPDDLLAAAASTRRRLEANARSRAHARSELSSWLERAMAKGVFDTPFSAAPKELLVPFTLSLPAPRCEILEPPAAGVARRCTKLLSLPYVIPFERSYEERELTFEVRIDMDAREVPRVVVLSGPDLFARLEETYAKDSVAKTDLASRIDAVERAVDVVSGAFEAEVSADPKCSQDVAAPDVVHLRCHGIDVVATLGGGAEGDDVVTITKTD